MRKNLGMIAVTALLASASIASANPARRMTHASTRVTLLIYSGLPDPVWTLTPAQTDIFMKKLEDLPRSANFEKLPETLGYRGFSVQIGQRQEIGVHHKIVRWRDGKVITAYSDPAQSLETWLFENSGGRLTPAVISEIRGNRSTRKPAKP
jgi:hypothetical protein